MPDLSELDRELGDCRLWTAKEAAQPLRLGDDVFESLPQEAEKEDRAISHMVRILVREALVVRKKYPPKKK